MNPERILAKDICFIINKCVTQASTVAFVAVAYAEDKTGLSRIALTFL